MRKLIFIYGPPAVGKLTVSKNLAKRVDAIVFHNHLTYDLAMSVLSPCRDFDTVKTFACKVRLHTMQLLFEHNDRDIIMTFYYRGIVDDWYIEALNSLCRSYEVIPYFVKLKAEKKYLFERVENSDRKKFGKITSRDKLAEVLSDRVYPETIHAVNHVCLDTSEFVPQFSSEKLVELIYQEHSRVRLTV